MAQSMTRRGFVGAAGASAAAGAAGLFAQHKALVAKADEIAWDEEADVIYVGAGGAGFYGAMASLELGESVILLEKSSEDIVGGDTRCYGGIFLGQSVPVLRENSLGKLSLERCQALTEGVAEATEWFRARTPEDWWIPGETIAAGSGRAVVQVLVDAAAEAGLRIDYQTAATRLVQDHETGAVIGLIAERDGQQIYYHANKAVVLTTGGYDANPELISLFHFPKLPTVTAGHPCVTGDGLIMGLSVGAALFDMGTSFDWGEFAFRKASEEMGTAIQNRQWETFGDFGACRNMEPVPSKIYVNLDGNRFMNEAVMMTHNKTIAQPFVRFEHQMVGAPNEYVNMPMFLVCDSKCFEGGPLGAVPNDDMWTAARACNIYQWSADNSEELARGWIYKADTLEELAEQMTSTTYMKGITRTVDAEALKATIEAFNASCDAVDEFGRKPEDKLPIDTPPYYAAEMMPAIVYTISGIKSDDYSRVVNWFGEPIEGLYAAGNVGQGNALTPYGAACCMAGAKIAAKYIHEPFEWPEYVEEGGEIVIVEGPLNDGTYTSTQTGIGGDFDITVTIEGGVITNVEFGPNNETPTVGGLALEQLPALIVEANGIAGVDGVGGASITSGAILAGVSDCMVQAQA